MERRGPLAGDYSIDPFVVCLAGPLPTTEANHASERVQGRLDQIVKVPGLIGPGRGWEAELELDREPGTVGHLPSPHCLDDGGSPRGFCLRRKRGGPRTTSTTMSSTAEPSCTRPDSHTGDRGPQASAHTLGTADQESTRSDRRP